MSGDIRSTLLSSDAAESLRMEMRIAGIFEQHKWRSERGVYFTDPTTGKPREIDVYVPQVFPKRSKGAGSPLVNLDVFCECKSLKGSNILLSAGSTPKFSRNECMSYWVGWHDDLLTIVMRIAEQAKIDDNGKIRALYDYVLNRAYPNEGRALRYPVSMPPPPVDLIASAFRETKSGKNNDDNATEQGRISPLWNAIRSNLSAIQACKAKSRNVCLEWIYGLDLKFCGIEEFQKSTTFFLDAELLRNSFFHPFIVLNANLWRLDSDQLQQVNSARIHITNIDRENVYVDIVTEASVEQYISATVSHFEKMARHSVSNLQKMLRLLGWVPGQAEEEFGKVLGW